VIWNQIEELDFLTFSDLSTSWWPKRTFWGVPFNHVYDMIQHDLTTHFTIFGIAMMCCVVECGLGVILDPIGELDFSTFSDLSCPGGLDALFGGFYSTVYIP
jgi:hypothetical protein